MSLDLFSQDLTSEQRLEDLRNLIKLYQTKIGIDSKRTKVKLFFGDIANFNSGVLVISNPPKAKFFETAEDKFICNILDSLEITKYFITYNYLIFGDKASQAILKEFGFYIRRLVDIINPKIIVCMGEESQFSFFKRKFMLGDFHGKQIGEYEDKPIMATYPISYYEERSKFEDHSYKTEIRNKDWTAIKNKYKELTDASA